MSKGAIYLVVIVLLCVGLAVLVNGGVGKKKTNVIVPSPVASPSATIIQQTQSTDTVKTMDTNELIKEDLVVGTGDEAVSGKKVTVNYSGTLTDGSKFDSSYDRGVPFSFTLGLGEVIQGWDLGVNGMKVGGKRKLTIPSSLGYGASGAGAAIPPNATLVFEVELLQVE